MEHEQDAQNSVVESLILDGWDTGKEVVLAAREGSSFSIDDLGLPAASSRFVAGRYGGRIYQHQIDAVTAFRTGHDVCLATGTASGKSLAFQLCALEILTRESDARVLAVYPLKALARQQEQRWQECLHASGLAAEVGRIDGGVAATERFRILDKARVIIATPDVIHAWLLANIGDVRVHNLLKKLRCVIIDEAHSYTGVFGSNAAFLYRRLEHAVKTVGGKIQYVAASATIASPEQHLLALTGHTFEMVGPDRDTSPKQRVTIHFLEPPEKKTYTDAMCDVIKYAAARPERFIAFVDSRKQTSQLAIIAGRSSKSAPQGVSAGEVDGVVDDITDEVGSGQILPYRSGYEDDVRRAIEDRLQSSTLQGVISTSALELGIDIGSLEVGILGGVPRSLTSFWQRVGRIGRQSPGDVYIIKNDDLLTKSVFADPQSLLSLPLSEGALYLENQRVQYIHALCLARHGGESDQVLSQPDPGTDFVSPVEWPKGFMELCQAERLGAVPPELQQMKSDSGDEPNRAFPLRDVEPQFVVRGREGMTEESLGSLSYAQVMREAYPGAIYYYVKRGYRVTKVQALAHRVEVRRERHYYTTKPELLPAMIYPNLSDSGVNALRCGDLVVAEAPAQIRDAVAGYIEMKGSQKETVKYPLDSAHGIFWDHPLFSRNYFTTGVFLSHPALNEDRVPREAIGTFLYEVFMSIVPVDRRDVSFGCGKHLSGVDAIHKGDRFIAIFDQTYGSLRLSRRFMEPTVLSELGRQLPIMIDQYSDPATGLPLNATARDVVATIASDMLREPQALNLFTAPDEGRSANLVHVIVAGSHGTSITRGGQEFEVERIFYNPVKGQLMYFGHYDESIGVRLGPVETTETVDAIKEIPGESTMGLYDPDTGEVKEIGTPS